ncbi:MAG: integrase core domain-containing protein [Vicinamibacteria bacterium]
MIDWIRTAAATARVLGRVAGRAVGLLGACVRDLTRPKERLLAENVALRAQLAALKRQVHRAQPDAADRVVLAAIGRVAPAATRATLHLVRPETLLRWHRELGRWLWARRSRPARPRRPPRRTRAELRALIVEMARENDWGSLRIVGELRKLGSQVSRRTVQRILQREFPNGRPAPAQSWATFVKNHLEGTWACDFFTVTTLGFRTLYVFFVLRLDTREVVLANVSEHPGAEWTTQQLRNACLDEAPARLIRDGDGKFTASADAVIEGHGGEVLRTPPRTQVANAYAERMVQTFRRELFDRVIPRDEDHVRALLREYLAHYHRRSHQGEGLGLRSPAQVRAGEAVEARDPASLDLGRLVVTPVLNGLVHEYSLVA